MSMLGRNNYGWKLIFLSALANIQMAHGSGKEALRCKRDTKVSALALKNNGEIVHEGYIHKTKKMSSGISGYVTSVSNFIEKKIGHRPIKLSEKKRYCFLRIRRDNTVCLTYGKVSGAKEERKSYSSIKFGVGGEAIFKPGENAENFNPKDNTGLKILKVEGDKVTLSLKPKGEHQSDISELIALETTQKMPQKIKVKGEIDLKRYKIKKTETDYVHISMRFRSFSDNHCDFAIQEMQDDKVIQEWVFRTTENATKEWLKALEQAYEPIRTADWVIIGNPSNSLARRLAANSQGSTSNRVSPRDARGQRLREGRRRLLRVTLNCQAQLKRKVRSLNRDDLVTVVKIHNDCNPKRVDVRDSLNVIHKYVSESDLKLPVEQSMASKRNQEKIFSCSGTVVEFASGKTITMVK